MKKTRKLVPAIALLLISALLLSTASYAWFSMNTQVTATGMQVTAKSNATYLLINDVNTAGAGSDTKAAVYQDTATNPDKKVYPAAYNDTADEVEVTNEYTAPADSWYTASNRNSNDANDAMLNAKLVTEDDDNYMLKYNVWLTLTPDSEAYTNGKIKITMNAKTGDAAAKAVVVIGDEKFEFDAANDAATMTANANLSATTTTEVTIYVYIDGDSDNVNSDYINGSTPISGTLGFAFDLVNN